MSNMQRFHNQLFSQSEAKSGYQNSLVRLTRSRRVQLAVLKSTLAWDQWPQQAKPV